jgi:hypothetical protein
LSDREKCRLMVARLAPMMKKEEPQVWGIAYFRLGKRANKDIRELAAKASMSTLDYIEHKGAMLILKTVLKSMHDDLTRPKPARKPRRRWASGVGRGGYRR